MLSAWALAAAAMALATAVCVRERAGRRAARRTAARCARAEAIAGLAAAALSHGATGALRLRPDGATLTCGEVPENVRAAACAAAGAGGATPSSGAPLERAVAALVAEGIGFRLPLPEVGEMTLVGTPEGGHATLFMEPAQRPASTAAAGIAGRLQQLLERVPHAAWIATAEGERLWANAAYAGAVGNAGAEPLLDANAAQKLAAGTDRGVAHERVQTVVAGERRLLDVTAVERDGSLAALAVDVTEAVQALAVQARKLDSHADTLDRLATAIAIYGPDRRLTFYNAAFQALWGLPDDVLEQAPPEERVLDRLRAERRLPETADFKAWKRDQLKGYETREGFERWWHLPDGQTLRVIANPGPDGGVTYIYENVTEQLALERRYNALLRVQAETIDNLGEGIASFGPDGLLRLANPAFFALTGIAPAEVGDHVRAIAAGAPAGAGDGAAWADLVRQVTGLTDHRTATAGRIERDDGRVLDYAFSPLPDGSTLAAFADVTDSVNVARALLDRNNALVEADRLKNAFIEHVSYELRSPLNTIIGFTQLLTRPETGPLSERQRDYATYISTSSEALLAIIDGILDLASIDAGIMELDIAPLDVADTVRHVLEGLKDRIAEAALDIVLELAPDARSFEGDALRVRQVLFNLLSNAVSHSPEGGTITIASRREGELLALSVRDRGPGIAGDKAEAVFERFHTAGAGGRRGGVGLGLSLVKSFVELHGGTVAVAPVEGPGAELVVRFPRRAGGASRPAPAAVPHAA